MATATAVLSGQLRWLSACLCRVNTGSTTYPVLRLLFLSVDCNSHAGCSRSGGFYLVWPLLCVCVCAVHPCKLGSASGIYFAVKGIINLTLGRVASYLKKGGVFPSAACQRSACVDVFECVCDSNNCSNP
jgi:hypothetical protein